MSTPADRQPNLLLRFVLGVLGLMALIVFVWVQQEKDATKRTTDRAALQDDANPFIKRTPKPIIAPAPFVLDEAHLAREMSKVMEATIRLKGVHFQHIDPSTASFQSYLKRALAQLLRMNGVDLRALLSHGRSSTDALAQAQALIACGKTTEAMAKFNQVIASEQTSAERLTQALRGRDLVEMWAQQLQDLLAIRKSDADRVEKSTQPHEWAEAQKMVARTLLDLQQTSEAEALYREILHFQEEQLDSDDAAVGRTLRSLAELLISTGRQEEAETLLRRNLANIEAKHGTGHGDVANALVPLAELLVEMNQPENAEPLALRAVSSMCRNHADAPLGAPNFEDEFYTYWQVAAALKLSREEIHSRLEAEAISAGMEPVVFEAEWQDLLKRVPPDPSDPP